MMVKYSVILFQIIIINFILLLLSFFIQGQRITSKERIKQNNYNIYDENNPALPKMYSATFVQLKEKKKKKRKKKN